MNFGDLQAHWDEFGRQDPFWAILTDSDKTGRRWNREEFFATGEQDVRDVVQALADAGRMPHPGRALDFGCGVGRLTQALCPRFELVLGLDIAPSMIEAARQFNRFPGKCEYRVNDSSCLEDLDDSSFDLVLSLIVLQHMRPEFATHDVREFMRVLKPGGFLVFQLPHKLTFPADRPEPMPGSAYRMVIEAQPLASVETGSKYAIQVTVTNNGDQPWPGGSDPAHMICAANHWLDSAGQPVHWDDARVPLPQPVAPGGSCSLDLPVTAPFRPGSYQLELDLVHEHVCWFAERGNQTFRFPVEVVPTAVELRPEPVMEMHGRPPHEVFLLIERLGGQIFSLSIDSPTVLPWLSYRYFAVRQA